MTGVVRVGGHGEGRHQGLAIESGTKRKPVSYIATSLSSSVIAGWALRERLDLVLVCGPYKSGTSLAAQRIERAGWWNPALATNPIEAGFGSEANRYWTRECRRARFLNERLLGSGACFDSILSWTSYHWWLASQQRLPAFSRLVYYLMAIGPKAVVKNPRFMFTLPLWVCAAGLCGLKVGVCFPARPGEELRRAWEAAPVTRSLLRAGWLSRMVRFQRWAKEFCQLSEVSRVMISFDRLKLGDWEDGISPCVKKEDQEPKSPSPSAAPPNVVAAKSGMMSWREHLGPRGTTSFR
jgi:hypothetical protein